MILGVDPGERRVGLAVADAETRFARPLEVVDVLRRDPVERIAEVVAELGITKVVVGRPVGLSGGSGLAVTAQRELLERLRARLPVAAEEFDERFTSIVAERGLKAGGAKRTARRRMLDAVAASVMLQGYLDASE